MRVGFEDLGVCVREGDESLPRDNSDFLAPNRLLRRRQLPHHRQSPSIQHSCIVKSPP